MKITIEVDTVDNEHKAVTIEAEDNETIEAVAAKAAKDLGVDPVELADDLGAADVSFDRQDTVGKCIRHGNKWRHRRVCVDVHYQSEDASRHFFNPQKPWRVVHEWACKHFHVAEAMCQDLELFAGSPTGQPLNENLPIGWSEECKVIWLAKRGPEPNG